MTKREERIIEAMDNALLFIEAVHGHREGATYEELALARFDLVTLFIHFRAKEEKK